MENNKSMGVLDLVCQEIERRINILTNVYAEQVERKDEEMMTYYHGKVIALEELRPFLDTLAEEPDKSLEEAAEEYYDEMWDELGGFAETRGGCYDIFFPSKAIRDTFIAGAEWQKSQMLKDAYVESQIVEDGRIELGGDPLPCLNPIILLPYPQFNPGDKVRIVVLKAEEE